MPFQIPEDLSVFSITGLADLIHKADAEYTVLVEALTPETVTDEQLDHAYALRNFARVAGPAELNDRQARQARLDGLSVEPEPPVVPEPTPSPDPEGVPARELEPVTASVSEPTIVVRIGDIVGQSPPPHIPEAVRPRYSTLVAAAGVPNYEAGASLPTMLDVAKAFEARSASHGRLSAAGTQGIGPITYPVAQLVRDYPPEFSCEGDATDYPKLLHLIDETRLPGGSLIRAAELRRQEIAQLHPERDAMVAAAGWCAPSETDYDICLQITTDGLYDTPEVQARRGGIRHNTGIQFDTIFGGCPTGNGITGFFNRSEAQVAAGSPTKTCLEIPCPEFIDTRLGITGLCLTGNILANRGYPEFTKTFVQGALAASAHQINALQIAAVVAGSTAVNLTAFAPWATDNSVVSQVMSAVEMAIVDIKYRLRMLRNATLEIVLPWWVLAQMRADWLRRNGGNYQDMLCLADSAITSAFSCRGARPQFVYDWQDAFANCAASGFPGADVPINSLPTSLQFLVYPAGTWVRAVSDVITLNSVFDSTLLATNQVTHLFTETGWAMVQMCPLSRVYTVGICPNGKTGLQRDITC